jgi:hypothetical protein
MWLAYYALRLERKCSNSQKSNDRILPVYQIVLTRQENYGLHAKSDSVFGIVLLPFLPNQNFSLLKNINTLEKYQRDSCQFLDLTVSAQLPDSGPITHRLNVSLLPEAQGKRRYALVPLAGQPEESLSR